MWHRSLYLHLFSLTLRRVSHYNNYFFNGIYIYILIIFYATNSKIITLFYRLTLFSSQIFSHTISLIITFLLIYNLVRCEKNINLNIVYIYDFDNGWCDKSNKLILKSILNNSDIILESEVWNFF